MNRTVVRHLPVPAPYLRDVPTLPDDVAYALGRPRPTAADVDKARKMVAKLRELIRRGRAAYEAKTGVRIAPEPPLAD